MCAFCQIGEVEQSHIGITNALYKTSIISEHLYSECGPMEGDAFGRQKPEGGISAKEDEATPYEVPLQLHKIEKWARLCFLKWLKDETDYSMMEKLFQNYVYTRSL